MRRPTETDYADYWDGSYRAFYGTGQAFRRPQDARTSSLREFLRWEQVPGPRGHVLDVGCGDGLNAVFLASLGYEVTGIDVSPVALARARAHAHERGLDVRFVCGDVRAMPCFADGAFALAIDVKTFHSLWTFRDRSAYLAELRRVMCPGAVLFFRQNCRAVELRDEFGWREFLGKPITGRSDDPDVERQGGVGGIWPNSMATYKAQLREAGFGVPKAVFYKGDPEPVSVIWCIRE